MDATELVSSLPSQLFQPRLFGVGAWTAHLHLGYDIVALLKPRVVVELGTDRGESYFCFCQAVLENDAASWCFAVDSWRGDEHAGGYDETTYEQVAAHNSAHYASFSLLLRSSFDDALSRFEDSSIDLLHLDGVHTEGAVRHDLDGWLRKLRPGGILLMHDVMVRTRGFGVWKVWHQIRRWGRSFTQEDGPGLAVWQKPPSSELPVFLEAFFDGNDAQTAALVQYYRERADGLQAQIAQQWQTGTIRDTAFGQQTVIQVFHTADGTHREEDSVYARLGHNKWSEVEIPLPANCGATPLRIDFVSALTCITIASISVQTASGTKLYEAGDTNAFGAIGIRGNAERLHDSVFLRFMVTGIDPQLYLPSVANLPKDEPLMLRMRLLVTERRH